VQKYIWLDDLICLCLPARMASKQYFGRPLKATPIGSSEEEKKYPPHSQNDQVSHQKQVFCKNHWLREDSIDCLKSQDADTYMQIFWLVILMIFASATS